ncbi:cytochrome P450 71A1-like [Lolium perenne]|uniref:cytochrome P450 71A1-like n=1 Tax=Lolium perenne TaxID=4522 RepID=UPI003A990243
MGRLPRRGRVREGGKLAATRSSTGGGKLEAWHQFLNEIIAQHLENNYDYSAMEDEEDFLDILLRLREEGTAGLELTDDSIKSLVKDMIFAGTKTTSITLEWAMAELIQNPRAMAKLQDEIARVSNGNPTTEEDDLHRMEYLKAVLKESLRLHPPAPLFIPHESTAAAVVQGYEIPAKTALFINAWAIGRDPAAWGDAAKEFQPERFLDGGGVASIDLRGNDYQLLPFGAGRRVCPAISFALPALEIALASLVGHFDWELPIGTRLDMSEAPGLTTPPLAPLRLLPKCKTLV